MALLTWTSLHINRYCSMVDCAFFKMAAVRHLAFLKVGNFNFRSRSEAQCASSYQISQRSVKPQRRYVSFIIMLVWLENAYSRPQNRVFGGFYPQNGEQYERDPKKHILGRKHVVWRFRSSKSVHLCGLGGVGASRRIKYKIKKGIPKKPQHVFFHMFAQTTHVVAAPHGFACVGIPATRLYIPSFIEIRSGVSELQGVKVWPFPLLWLVAFTTAYWFEKFRIWSTHWKRFCWVYYLCWWHSAFIV